MDEHRIRYAISVRMSPQIKDCIEALPENHWKPAGEEADAIREWAEINYVPSDGNWSKEHDDAAALSGDPPQTQAGRVAR